MCTSSLSRRQFLRYSALVAATFPAAGLLGSRPALAQQTGLGLAVPMNLELVTVSHDRAVMTWFTGDPTQLDAFGRPLPVAAPGRVLIGTDPNPLTWVAIDEPEPTAYHVVEVAGLAIGTTYYWRAESGGLPATPAAARSRTDLQSAPPSFTTMVPPPGRELGTIAWVNDLHFGEQIAGLIRSDPDLPGGGLPPGFPVDPDDPYWRFMSDAMVTEARGRGATLLLANGDLSNESEPEAIAACKRSLDGFDALAGGRDLRPGDDPAYFVTRGNHDRVRTPEGIYASCAAGDCFQDAFSAAYEPGSTHFSVTFGDAAARYRFVGLDSNDGATTGTLTADELDYLEAELARGDATIPMFHHPAVAETGLNAPLPGSVVDGAEAFRAIVARNPNVAGVYAGHTHRNARIENSDTGPVPFFEGGAVKEYPGGYTTVRLFEGGYQVNFWKTTSPSARAWSERSRGEFLGLAPLYQLGGLADRNWTYAFDATVAPAPEVPEVPYAALLPVAAVAAGAGVLASRRGESSVG